MNLDKLKVITSSCIPNFKGSNYNLYHQKCIDDFRNIKKYFPLLTITNLPTTIPKQIFLKGELIPEELLGKCKSNVDIQRYSLYILVTYPDNFPESDIIVEDLLKKINWNRISYEHRHENMHPQMDRKVLCTHHPNGEINKLKSYNKSIAILLSAWKLYRQYKKYLSTGIWMLDDLLHGEHGEMQLKNYGDYYDK